MPGLSPALQHLLDRALVSLAAWHVLEALAECQGPLPLSELVDATGLHIDEAQGAVDALVRSGLLVRLPVGACLEPARVADVRELCARVEADPMLHRAVVKQAAVREMATGGVQLTITWGPHTSPAASLLSAPSAPLSLNVRVPAVRGPIQSTDRTAPAT